MPPPTPGPLLLATFVLISTQAPQRADADAQAEAAPRSGTSRLGVGLEQTLGGVRGLASYGELGPRAAIQGVVSFERSDVEVGAVIDFVPDDGPVLAPERQGDVSQAPGAVLISFDDTALLGGAGVTYWWR